MFLLQIAAIVLACIVLIAAAVSIWCWSRPRKPPRIERKKHSHFDPVLGICDVEMPVEGQWGRVTCQTQIDDSKCTFSDSFSDGVDSAPAIKLCLERLRSFYRLASNPEQLKICKNALQEAFAFHEALYPKLPLSIEVLKERARLSHVRVTNADQASFTFRHPIFMGGGTITMHVGSNGNISFVGVP